MKLRITYEDINDAKRDSELDCPIARAFRRRFPGNVIQVFDRSILVNGTHFEHTRRSGAYALDWNEGEAEPDVLPFHDIRHALKKKDPAEVQP